MWNWATVPGLALFAAQPSVAPAFIPATGPTTAISPSASSNWGIATEIHQLIQGEVALLKELSSSYILLSIIQILPSEIPRYYMECKDWSEMGKNM